MPESPAHTPRPLGLNLGLWERMTSWQETIEIVRLAEELGYDCVSIPESFGRDGFTLCDRMLAATRSIKVNLGLAIYYGPESSPYAEIAAKVGHADDVAALRQAYAEGGSEAAVGVTSDRLARSVATRAECEPILEGMIAR